MIHCHVKEKYDHFEGGPVSFVQFEGEDHGIHLELSGNLVFGWTLEHLKPDKVCQCYGFTKWKR